MLDPEVVRQPVGEVQPQGLLPANKLHQGLPLNAGGSFHRAERVGFGESLSQ